MAESLGPMVARPPGDRVSSDTRRRPAPLLHRGGRLGTRQGGRPPRRLRPHPGPAGVPPVRRRRAAIRALVVRSGHRGRMDAARVVITAVLTIGVLLVVLLALARGDSLAAAQYAAPVSGVASICLGW